MVRVTEPGKMAGWVAPPVDGHPRQAGRLRVRQDLTTVEGWGTTWRPSTTPRRLLDRHVEDGRGRPPRPSCCGDGRLTYADLHGEVRATAAGLRRMGVGPEQRVAMVMLDDIEFSTSSSPRCASAPSPSR